MHARDQTQVVSNTDDVVSNLVLKAAGRLVAGSPLDSLLAAPSGTAVVVYVGSQVRMPSGC